MTAPMALTGSREFLEKIGLHFSSFDILYGYYCRRNHAVVKPSSLLLPFNSMCQRLVMGHPCHANCIQFAYMPVSEDIENSLSTRETSGDKFF